MRGRPKRLLETTCEKMAGTSFYIFWFRFIPEMFSTLSAAFLCGQAFVCFYGRLAVRYFAVYSNFNGNGNECGGCVSVRYLQVNALIARELSGFTCTSSLTMNEKFQYRTRRPRAVSKISSSLLVNSCR